MLQDARQCGSTSFMLSLLLREMCAIFGPESLVPALPKVTSALLCELADECRRPWGCCFPCSVLPVYMVARGLSLCSRKPMMLRPWGPIPLLDR